MRRREFVAALGTAAALPLAARAQPSGKVYRIGFLGVTSHAEYRRLIDGFQKGLGQLGYEEGKNIVIHYRWAEGRYESLPQLATELVKLNVDVLVTHSTPGSLAAKQTTSTIPIVVAAIGDPVEAGLVASLARPGGNLTGLTFFFAEIGAKRVELIKEAIPTLARAAILVNPANTSAAHLERWVGRATCHSFEALVLSRGPYDRCAALAKVHGYKVTGSSRERIVCLSLFAVTCSKPSEEGAMTAHRTWLRAGLLCLLAASASAESSANAQTYPAGPVKYITPLAAGTATDPAMRIVIDQLGRIWGQQTVLVNQPGAGGAIAARAAATAASDGSTLLMALASTFAVLPENAV